MILPAPNPRLLVLTRHHGSARSSQRRNGGRPSTGDSRRFTTRTCGARHGPRQATIRLAVSILVGASLLTGCGGGSSPPESQPATGSPAGHSERGTYASTTFLVPFDVTPPDWLGSKPHIEQPNFVTWEPPALPAVRFLAPVNVYQPAARNTSAPPKDYLSYLLGQTSHGARFTDQSTRTIGGLPATLVTATTERALDGSLGCPATKTPAAECFGLQPDLALRIAVVEVHGRTLLIWLRLAKDADAADTKARVSAFEHMLGGLRFSDRTVAPAPSQTSQTAQASPTTSPIDGTYVMSISWPRTHTATAKCVGGPEGKSPRTVYELSLANGEMQLWVRIGGPSAPREPADSGSFRVTADDKFVFHDGTTTAKIDYRHRTLTLSDLRGGECGDRAIWTTKPWTRT